MAGFHPANVRYDHVSDLHSRDWVGKDKVASRSFSNEYCFVAFI